MPPNQGNDSFSGLRESVEANFTSSFVMLLPIWHWGRVRRRKKSTQPDVRNTGSPKGSHSTTFVPHQSKPQSVNHATLRGRRLLHQVKNRRHPNVRRRFFYSTMLTTYTRTLTVPKHWTILLASLFLRSEFICNSRNSLEFTQLDLCNDFATTTAKSKVPLFCQHLIW